MFLTGGECMTLVIKKAEEEGRGFNNVEIHWSHPFAEKVEVKISHYGKYNMQTYEVNRVTKEVRKVEEKWEEY